ncbi:hypothetical protein ACUIAJ_05985, partial [Dermabacteraceae bacterium CCM 9519]
VASIMWAVGKAVWSLQIKEFKVVVQLLIKVAIAQSASVMAVPLMIKAGDDIWYFKAGFRTRT